MYQDFFSLSRAPFSIVPDPDLVLWTKQHRLAFSLLQLGTNGIEPIVVLTGEIGTGKTTLVSCLLRLAPKGLTVGLLSNFLSGRGSLKLWILMAFDQGISDAADAVLLGRLQTFLAGEAAAGRHCMLIIDEAHSLSAADLDELCSLATHACEGRLSLVLVGQPALREMLQRPENQAIARHVSRSFHLGALSGEDTVRFVRHRCALAGASADMFSHGALREVHRISGGVPRKINVICNLCLSYAFADGVRVIDRPLVRSVIADARKNGIFSALTADDPAAASVEEVFSPGVPAPDAEPEPSLPTSSDGRVENEPAHGVLSPTPTPCLSPPPPTAGRAILFPRDPIGASAKADKDPVFEQWDAAAAASVSQLPAMGLHHQSAERPRGRSARVAGVSIAVLHATVGYSLAVGGFAALLAGALPPAGPELPLPSIWTATPRPHHAGAVADSSSQPWLQGDGIFGTLGRPVSHSATGPALQTAESVAPNHAPTLPAPPAIARLSGSVPQLPAGVDRLLVTETQLAGSPLPAPLPRSWRAGSGARPAENRQPVTRAGFAVTAVARPAAPVMSAPAPLPGNRGGAGGALVVATSAPGAAVHTGRTGPARMPYGSIDMASRASWHPDGRSLRHDTALDDLLVAGTTPLAVASVLIGDDRAAQPLDGANTSEGALADALSTKQFRQALDVADRDPAAAALGYARAALGGHPRAAYYLGQIYETGDGVPVDFAMARAWYERAASLGGQPLALLEGLPPPEAGGTMAPPRPLFAERTGDTRADFVWTSGDGADPAAYVVEVANNPQDVATRFFHARSAAARLPLPTGARHWRVLAVDAANSRYAASEWQTIPDTGDSAMEGQRAGDPSARPVVTVANAGPDSERAMEMTSALTKHGISSRIAEAASAGLPANSVIFFYAQDAASAQRIAGLAGAAQSLRLAIQGAENPPMPGSILLMLPSAPTR